MSTLLERRCANCAPGAPALSPVEQERFGREIPEWQNLEGARIRREFKFKTYLDGIEWAREAGQIVDAEDHHPDLRILYRKVIVELWTHTVKGLSENDYIVAAKLDRLFEAFPGKR
jgi:4a-hydroxytetrahydrobiopterin dehydratase